MVSSSVLEIDVFKEFSDKIKLNSEVLDKNYPEVKITEKNKERVQYFSKFAEGSVRMQMGIFYTEEEREKDY